MAEIRAAIVDDADPLSEIALASKGHWGYPPEWLEAWRDQLTITPAVIEQDAVFLIEEAGRIGGFYVLQINSEPADLDHLWVEPVAMGKGWGGMLLEHAVSMARANNIKAIRIEADPNAESFYSHMGALTIGSVAADVLGNKRDLPLMQINI